MPKLAAVLLLVAAVLAAIAITPRESGADKVSYAAKADFIKKCFRDLGGRGSCQAPAEARLPKGP